MKTVKGDRHRGETHPWEKRGRGRVSSNGHFLEYENGTGFFWLGTRNGFWHVEEIEYRDKMAFEIDIPSGRGSPDHFFVPPGKQAENNDWVLVLEVARR